MCSHYCMIYTLAIKRYECILQFSLHCTLTIVSHHLRPTPTAVSTQSKSAHWCNSHFIHCTKVEVGDGVWCCIRARHWASGVRGGSPSPVLHRVTSDHLTRSQYSSAPNDSDFSRFIQCHHWHTSRRRLRYSCRKWWSLNNEFCTGYNVVCHTILTLLQYHISCKKSWHLSQLYKLNCTPITVLSICSCHVK